MRDAHLSDHELVLAADGELSLDRERHLAGCAQCRARRIELEDAAGLLRRRRDSLPPAGPAFPVSIMPESFCSWGCTT